MSIGWHNRRNNRIIRNDKTVMLDDKTPVLEEGKTYHITAQFIPPLCQMYVNGKLYMEYRDVNFLTGLNRIGVFTFGNTTFDNLKIYVRKGGK